MRRLTALAADRASAQRVVDALIALGLAHEEVSLLVVTRQELREGTVEHTTAVPQGVAVGTALGASLGLGLVAVGWLPGVFAMGPALAALQALAGGVAAGSVVGALAGLGWWKVEAEVPKEILEVDAVLVGVPISDERAEQGVRAAEAAGARRVYLT